jgi:predicted kinase
MLLGYPGAGKTTTAKILEKLTRAYRLTSDDERLKMFPDPSLSQEEHARLYQKLDDETERLLASGQSVIYDANLNRYTHRKEKYKICQKTNAIPVLIWLNTGRDISETRATDKTREKLWPINETAEAMFNRIANLIEPPNENEHPIILEGSNLSPEIVQSALETRNSI